jgi:hypothetical protein
MNKIRKITEEVKTSHTFIFAKMKGANNREAARFCRLMPEGIIDRKCTDKTAEIYFLCSKEPKVNTHQYAYSIDKEGVQVPTRSKLVMAYERHRKHFEQIVRIRTVLSQEMCDKAVAELSLEQVKSAESAREAVLIHLSHKIAEMTGTPKT